MNGQKVLEVFVKAEENLKTLLSELPTANGVEQVNKLAGIQQTSYLLERLNKDLFQKITKTASLELKKLRDNCPQMKEIGKISVDEFGIQFTHDGQSKVAPLLDYQQIIKKFNLATGNDSGKYLKISYLLRPENYLDICLITFWRKDA